MKKRRALIEHLEQRIAPAAVVFDRSGSEDGVPDQLVLARDGAQLTLTVNGALAKTWQFDQVDSLTIIGSSDDDTLTVALDSGAVIPAGGLVFDGAAGFDTLQVRGGSVAQERHVAFDSHSGVITLDGRTIEYRAIEPVNDTVAANSFTFNAPAGVQTINIDNSLTPGLVTISSATNSFESISFANKTAVTINAGDSADTINVNGTSATGLTTLTIDGGSDNSADIFNINATTVLTTLTGGNGSDTFNLANGVSLNGGSIAGDAGTDTLNLAAFTAGVTVNLTAGTSSIGVLTGIENVTGGSGDDTITGDSGVNVLKGGPGNDTIAGAAGGDQLVGDAGNDTLIWNNGDGSDFMEGGADNDKVQVNGSSTGGDQFLIQVNPADPARLRFDRTNLGLFNLNIGTTEALEFNTLGGDDTTTVDFAGGNPIPVGGILFDGGIGDDASATADRLVLQSSAGTFTASSEVYTGTSPDAGVISVDGAPITFVNLAPVDDTLPATDFTFNPPPGTHAINFVTGPTLMGLKTTQINSSTGNFELVNFANKSNVTLNLGAGADLITFDYSVAAANLVNLTVNAGAGDDTIKVNAAAASGAIILNGGDGSDFFKVAASASATIQVDGGAPTAKPGDVLNFETNGVPAVLGEGVITSQGLANVTFAAVEDVFLSNRTLRLLNDTTAVFTDVDGDLVTIKTTRGILKFENFQLELNDAETGAQLQKVDLTAATGAFSGANLTISAKRSAHAGDGFVNVGLIDATEVDLGVVSITGDLGAIDAGSGATLAPAVKKLLVQSLGRFGTSTGAPDLTSTISGDLPNVSIKADVVHAIVRVSNIGGESGKIGKFVIGGALLGGNATFSGSIFASGDIETVKIGGDLVSGAGDFTGSIRSNRDIGSVTITGSLIGTAAEPVRITAWGQGAPTNTTDVAIQSVTVKNRVEFAEVLAGYDQSGKPVNADAQIGKVKVGGDWIASSISAGVDAANGRFGDDDDKLIDEFGATGQPDSPAIFSRIAAIMIKGQVIGTLGGGDHFGFVAQQIGSLKLGATRFPLTTGIGNDIVGIGATGDVTLRELSM